MTQNVSDILLERYLADDVSDAQRERIEELAAAFPAVHQRLSELRKLRDTVLDEVPPDVFAHRLVARLDYLEAEPTGSKRWQRWLLGPLALTLGGAAAFLLTVLSPSEAPQIDAVFAPAQDRSGDYQRIPDAQAKPESGEAELLENAPADAEFRDKEQRSAFDELEQPPMPAPKRSRAAKGKRVSPDVFGDGIAQSGGANRASGAPRAEKDVARRKDSSSRDFRPPSALGSSKISGTKKKARVRESNKADDLDERRVKSTARGQSSLNEGSASESDVLAEPSSAADTEAKDADSYSQEVREVEDDEAQAEAEESPSQRRSISVREKKAESKFSKRRSVSFVVDGAGYYVLLRRWRDSEGQPRGRIGKVQRRTANAASESFTVVPRPEQQELLVVSSSEPLQLKPLRGWIRFRSVVRAPNTAHAVFVIPPE